MLTLYRSMRVVVNTITRASNVVVQERRRLYSEDAQDSQRILEKLVSENLSGKARERYTFQRTISSRPVFFLGLSKDSEGASELRSDLIDTALKGKIAAVISGIEKGKEELVIPKKSEFHLIYGMEDPKTRSLELYTSYAAYFASKIEDVKNSAKQQFIIDLVHTPQVRQAWEEVKQTQFCEKLSPNRHKSFCSLIDLIATHANKNLAGMISNAPAFFKGLDDEIWETLFQSIGVQLLTKNPELPNDVFDCCSKVLGNPGKVEAQDRFVDRVTKQYFCEKAEVILKEHIKVIPQDKAIAAIVGFIHFDDLKKRFQ